MKTLIHTYLWSFEI